jgi:MYXO-CTERM domain-containing protein
MDNFSSILRTVVFFLFPIPFLLDFAVAHGDDWTGTVAYAAVAVLALAAVAAGWAMSRRRGP